MSEHEKRWTVVEGSAKAFVQTVTSGPHTLIADEPPDVGGTDKGPSPFDLLASALGACTSMTLGMYARRKEWPLEHVRVRVRPTKVRASDLPGGEGKQGIVDVFDREIELTGNLDDEQRARLLEIANKCPVHQALTKECLVRSKLV